MYAKKATQGKTNHYSVSLHSSLKKRRFWGMLNCLAIQSCPTLFGHMDYSLPGSTVHGILQARIWEWVAIALSRGSSWPLELNWIGVSHTAGIESESPALQADSLPSEPQEGPMYVLGSVHFKYKRKNCCQHYLCFHWAFPYTCHNFMPLFCLWSLLFPLVFTLFFPCLMNKGQSSLSHCIYLQKKISSFFTCFFFFNFILFLNLKHCISLQSGNLGWLFFKVYLFIYWLWWVFAAEPAVFL